MVGWAYTAPPFRLAYHPLGEAASGLPMGLGIVWGTAAAQTASVPYAAWWAAAPLALLTAGILHANNARDRSHDAAVGKRTLATRVSVDAVVLEFRLLVGLPAVLLARRWPPAACRLWCLGAALPALLGPAPRWLARAATSTAWAGRGC